MIECICIDNKNKPNIVPLSCWIEEKFKYHITHVHYHPKQGISGVDLAEVKFPSWCNYQTYKLSRFAISLGNLFKLIEMIKDCTELNDVDINKLLEESEVEVLNW